MTTAVIPQVLVLLLVPALTAWMAAKSKVIKVISPVVLCYAIGIFLANFKVITIDEEVSFFAASGAVLVAIPLLLMSLDFSSWLRLAKSTLVSMLLAFTAVVIMSVVAFLIFHNRIDENWKVAGMLVGTFTGGSPNMASLRSALRVNSEQYLLVNAADVVLCTAYFFILLFVAPPLLSRFLRPFKRSNDSEPEQESEENKPVEKPKPMPLLSYLPALGMGVLIAALGGVAYLVTPKSYRDIVVILCVTTLGLLASFQKKIRAIRGSYELGQFILLIFCIGIGSLANVSRLISMSPAILVFTAVMLIGTILLHLLFCKVFRIDRDTWIITSAASIFSPAFVGIFADRLKNREIVVSGVSAGLVGFAVGNYLGVAVSLGLQRFLSNA